MGRKIHRVPLDFDAPLNETWSGYVMPDDLLPLDCPKCDGSGYSPGARAIAETFYPHQIGHGPHAEALAWHDKLGEKEVAHLKKRGRFDKRITTAEVNEAQRNPARAMREGLAHDAINRFILIEYRCKRLGIPLYCAVCKGSACVEKYVGQRKESRKWRPTPPPTGDGWQMWETTSEGSPITPVFETAEELADYLVTNEISVFGNLTADREQWLGIIRGTDDGMVLIAPGVAVV